MDDRQFDDIRPYRDDEIPAAMERIAVDEHLAPILDFAMPDTSVEQMGALLRSIKTIDEFQRKIMFPVTQSIIDNTMAGVTYGGIDGLSADRGWLYVSNHRDIVVDSLLLQRILFDNELPTSEITFGSNLMSSQLVIDIGKSNKMFRVERKGANLREFLANSAHLSDYIRQTVAAGRSIWIAQRNGRTKDGNDATDQGLVKMFSMSGSRDRAESIGGLNIVPVAISYQWEPCDIFKTREMYLSRNGQKYVKAPDEDLNSILTGIMQPKGGVHIELARPIGRDELAELVSREGDFFKNLAELIDKRIYAGYKLFDTNYIAHDLRSGGNRYSEHYTAAQRAAFESRMAQLREQVPGEWNIISDIFLGIYANSVDNAERARRA